MSPAPAPDEVYQFALISYDRQTGKVLWQQTAREEQPHEGHHRSDGTFASNSPITDGEHIYAYFGSRGLHCYDLAGKHQWSQYFGKMRIVMAFGEGTSPALYGNTLVVNWDNEGECFIVAVDKATGKTLWKKPREERTSWATPLIIERDGKPQVIAPASNKVRAYDLATGDLLWECAGLTGNVIPSPVTDNENLYCMSGYRGSALLAIRLGGKGDLSGSDKIVWKSAKNTPYVPSPLLCQDRLYFFSVNTSTLTCLEAKTGKPVIDAQELSALSGVYASPIGADGRVYCVGRNGTTVVLKQADKLEVLATNTLADKIDASPAAAGKDLFLRGEQTLYCISQK